MTIPRLLVVVLLLTAGCVSATPPPAIATANIGPPPSNYESAIQAAIGAQLRDRYSAVYTFRRPVRSWFCSDDIRWAVCGTVNAKNAFGGFVGAKPYVAFFRHGKIESVSYDNSIDAGLCPKWYEAGYYD